jgi:hypothetical protein
VLIGSDSGPSLWSFRDTSQRANNFRYKGTRSNLVTFAIP